MNPRSQRRWKVSNNKRERRQCLIYAQSFLVKFRGQIIQNIIGVLETMPLFTVFSVYFKNVSQGVEPKVVACEMVIV